MTSTRRTWLIWASGTFNGAFFMSFYRWKLLILLVCMASFAFAVVVGALEDEK